MADLTMWIIESKHKNPSDFYVKVDGSDYYTGSWVANTISTQLAKKLVKEVCTELNLGNVEFISVTPFTNHTHSTSKELQEKINHLASQIKDHEDAQLAAWSSSNGGLW